MANMISKDSFDVIYKVGESRNIQDVAEDLYQSIKESNLKYSITASYMLQKFLSDCGVKFI